jgi:NAD(P)-dependent dehydrogenase (short-subunit alcohol dehydrogenase family)
MTFDFSADHIIITGGTGALGSAVTAAFLEAGAVCSIPCFNPSETANFEFKDHKNVHLQLNVDLTDEQQTRNFYEEAVNQQGALWGSVHIAGGFEMAGFRSLEKQDFMKQINMNLITCFNACSEAVRHMKNGGRIVNVSSRPGIEPRQGAGRIPYATSKAAVAALTTSLAEELVEDDILVNAIAPSTIDTPANRNSMPKAKFDQWTRPEDLATQILYLVSHQNKITRGAVVPVYGKV